MATHTTDSGAAFVPQAACDQQGAIARQLLERAKAAGLDEAEVLACGSETISVRMEGPELKLTSVDRGAGIGLRVFHDHRAGFASSNQASEAAMERSVSGAQALAAAAPVDAANELLPPSPTIRNLPVPDKELCSLPVTEVIERARDLAARALAVDPRLHLDDSQVVLSRGAAALHSTTGAAASEASASLTLSLFGMAVEGQDVGGFDYWGAHALNLTTFEERADDAIERFTAAALGNLGASAASSYRGPVLFSPAAFMEVFVDPLVHAASAIAVQRGRSCLAGKLGESIASSSLSVLDDPTRTDLRGQCTFDREGQPTSPFSIVQAGTLQAWLHNGYTAKVGGVATTGHAQGGPRAVPGLGPHALCVEPGKGGDSNSMLAHLGTGLVVGRFSGSVDPSSGDFSGVAKSARWVENGEIVRSVRETLFSGNLFELLPQLVQLSSSAESVMGSASAPWALVDGVAVTAG